MSTVYAEPGPVYAGPEAAFQPVHETVLALAKRGESRAFLRLRLPGPLSPLSLRRFALVVGRLVPFVPDPDGFEVVKSPEEAMRSGGDCEDQAVVAGTALFGLVPGLYSVVEEWPRGGFHFVLGVVVPWSSELFRFDPLSPMENDFRGRVVVTRFRWR